jgi:hypothetical protein
MVSSAQNSSGVHGCRRRVRLNGVPEKDPEKVWNLWFMRRVRFNGVPEKVPKVPQKVPEKVWET